MILSQQQENVYEGPRDIHPKSCSWARKLGNVTNSTGWASSRQEINLKSD